MNKIVQQRDFSARRAHADRRMDMQNKRLVELMDIGGRIEVGYARSYAILTGAKELTADRKRLAKLCLEGYMVESWREGRKIYYLSSKGLSMVESHMKKPYNPKGYTTDHALWIAEFAAYIHLKYGFSVDSFVFDREMEEMEEFKPQEKARKMAEGVKQPGGRKEDSKKVHAPDFYIGSWCYEVELNAKKSTELERNFSYNSLRFDKQVWLVPERLSVLQTRLKKLSEKYHCPVKIITLEQVNDYLKTADLHSNGYGRRVEPKLKEVKQEKNLLEELV